MKTSRCLALTPTLLMAAVLELATTATCVAQSRVAEVQVAPAAITLRAGTTQKLIAVAYDAEGNVVPTGVRFRWSSNNLNVARVDSLGSVTAVAEGSAVIRAEALGSGQPLKHGAAMITVRRRAP